MPADAGVIDVESRHGVGWIVMSRPPLNVVTAGMAREMRAAVEQLDADTSSSVIVITAHGDRAFAAGADVEEHRLELIRDLNDELFALADTLRKADGKPRIAVVKGICSGGANEIAFACDIVVARSDTRFALPEINIGAVNNFGALLMAQIVSPSRVLELALTGDWISAEEAAAWGLVTRILPQDEFEVALERYLERFTSKSIAALRVGRKHFRSLMNMTCEQGLAALPDVLMGEAIQLEDYEEGVAAFLEKRKPVWRHR
jgi:enoyl-CoA hydratase/carnithine racemase